MTTGARMRRPRGRRRGAPGTREALLAAGTELFAERGYEGVPVWAIAQAAGVNKAMISYHFGGKRKLYLAIVNASFAEIVTTVERLADSSRPAPELLRELARQGLQERTFSLRRVAHQNVPRMQEIENFHE